MKRLLCVAMAGCLASFTFAVEADASGRVVRNGSPAYIKKRERAALRSSEGDRIAHRECWRHRGWPTYPDCVARYRGRRL